ncbi:MAG: QueT transporter family protein [bacterium]|nr:QueT transporter family protein [bacterium]
MKNKRFFTPHRIALSAMIAALYTGLTFVLAPISFGPVQFRVSEALTLLPFCLPEAVPGLFVGCLISNMLGGFGITDIILGSAATLAAAWVTAKMPNVWLAALPPVVINAVVVGAYIALLSSTPVIWSMLYIGASQAVICYAIGIPLILYIKRSGILEKYR